MVGWMYDRKAKGICGEVRGSSREIIPLDRDIVIYMYMMCPKVFEEVSRKFPFITCP